MASSGGVAEAEGSKDVLRAQRGNPCGGPEAHQSPGHLGNNIPEVAGQPGAGPEEQREVAHVRQLHAAEQGVP